MNGHQEELMLFFFGGGRIDIVFISVGNGPDGPDKIMLNQTQFYYVTTDLVID